MSGTYLHAGVPTLLENIRVRKLSSNAEVPSRANPTDIGLDVTLIARCDNRVEDNVGEVSMFHTGIAVQPPRGYFLAIAARSSLQSAGYYLATGMSIIDPSYTREVLVPLIKFRESADDIELPFTAVQLILLPALYANIIATDIFPETTRGGFGSTTQQPKKHSGLTLSLSTATSAAAAPRQEDEVFEPVVRHAHRKKNNMF